MIFITLVFILSEVFGADAANILEHFPTPSISHQVTFRPLTQELGERGHQVTVITTDPAFNLPTRSNASNITEINVQDKSYEIWRNDFDENGVIKGLGKSLDSLEIIFRKSDSIFDYQINTEEVSNIVQTQKYDITLVEACVEIALTMSHILKTPVIQISSFGSLYFNDHTMGAPSQPLLYPDPMRKKIHNLSLLEKVNILREAYEYRRKLGYLEIVINVELIPKYIGPTSVTLTDLRNEVDMLLLNTYFIWEGNRPIPPNLIHIGGMHQPPIKELPSDIQKYLDSSKHGVIYMSFGTNVDPTQLPNEKIQIFCKVFSTLKYDVLWKWNGDELPGRPKNVRISKWFPQPDLLKHPKIKLFITQGGFQSTDESITAGVPFMAFPMLGDQWYNAEKYVYHNIGLKMDLEKLTEENLEESIQKVIDDPSYRYNVKRLGVLMRDQPQSPLERAVWWTEYVLRHGGAKHLRSPAANISWAEYLVLDVLAVLFGILLLVFIILVLSFNFVCKIISCSVIAKSKLKHT